MAHAEKPIEDKALGIREAVQASLEIRLNPEQQQWREAMNIQLAKRPHAWTEIINSETGLKVIVAKLVDLSLNNSSAKKLLFMSDNGPGLIALQTDRYINWQGFDISTICEQRNLEKRLTQKDQKPGTWGVVLDERRDSGGYPLAISSIQFDANGLKANLENDPSLVADLDKSNAFFKQKNDENAARSSIKPAEVANF